MGMVANSLLYTVADRMQLLESVPAMHTAWLCDTALAAWVPTTVERYSKLLVEWQSFAETHGGRWGYLLVGLVLSFAD